MAGLTLLTYHLQAAKSSKSELSEVESGETDCSSGNGCSMLVNGPNGLVKGPLGRSQVPSESETVPQTGDKQDERTGSVSGTD